MKTIATIIFILFTAFASQAQTVTEDIKGNEIETIIVTETSSKELTLDFATEVARLYKRTNTRVKKELTFSTKANRAKTA